MPSSAYGRESFLLHGAKVGRERALDEKIALRREIARLEAENERLRTALEYVARGTGGSGAYARHALESLGGESPVCN